jgi:septum formation protein
LQILWQERSQVVFAALTDEALDTYLATRSWRGHSGAYAIQEQGDPYVRVVEGSVTNVIGLPMESLTRVLDWLLPGETPNP